MIGIAVARAVIKGKEIRPWPDTNSEVRLKRDDAVTPEYLYALGQMLEMVASLIAGKKWTVCPAHQSTGKRPNTMEITMLVAWQDGYSRLESLGDLHGDRP